MPQAELDVKTDAKGRVIYTYRGQIERGIGGSYQWRLKATRPRCQTAECSIRG